MVKMGTTHWSVIEDVSAKPWRVTKKQGVQIEGSYLQLANLSWLPRVAIQPN